MSLRNRTTTKLRAAMAAMEIADARLREDGAHWPDVDADMTPHEVDEARQRITGIRGRLAEAIREIEKPVARPEARA